MLSLLTQRRWVYFSAFVKLETSAVSSYWSNIRNPQQVQAWTRGACLSVSSFCLPWRARELSNVFSSETILPRNLEGGKHSSKEELQCVSYYSVLNCLTALWQTPRRPLMCHYLLMERKGSDIINILCISSLPIKDNLACALGPLIST